MNAWSRRTNGKYTVFTEFPEMYYSYFYIAYCGSRIIRRFKAPDLEELCCLGEFLICCYMGRREVHIKIEQAHTGEVYLGCISMNEYHKFKHHLDDRTSWLKVGF